MSEVLTFCPPLPNFAIREEAFIFLKCNPQIGIDFSSHPHVNHDEQIYSYIGMVPLIWFAKSQIQKQVLAEG
jgi:hypothetical protein